MKQSLVSHRGFILVDDVGADVDNIAPKGIIWQVRSIELRILKKTSHFLNFSNQVAENYVHEPAFLSANRHVTGGSIGRPTFFNAISCFHVAQDNKFYHTSWRHTAQYQG